MAQEGLRILNSRKAIQESSVRTSKSQEGAEHSIGFQRSGISETINDGGEGRDGFGLLGINLRIYD